MKPKRTIWGTSTTTGAEVKEVEWKGRATMAARGLGG